MKETLNNQAKKPIATRVIIKFLHLTFTLNTLHLMVLNISKRKAVSWAQFAHLLMKTLSWENLKNYTFTPTLETFSTFYCESMGDIFFSWNGTESELIIVVDNLNQKHPTIKFDFTYSRTSITFLDTKVYKNENETLVHYYL